MSQLALFGGPKTIAAFSPATQWPVIDDGDRQTVANVLERRKWWMYESFKDVTVGPPRSYVEEFETAFAALHRVKHGIAVTSGSMALEICMRALGLRPGDEVITTPYTFIATASCILNHQAYPVFVDIDPETYNINPALIEAAITPRTRAILPVHFGGEIADMDAILTVARRHGLPVIEDAAHAHGAALRGDRYAGGFDRGGIFSFQQSKNLTAGEGGIILTNDDAFAESCWSLRHYGRAKGEAWYAHFRLGWNGRMDEFNGALLWSQLRHLPAQIQRRDENYAWLRQALADLPGLRPTRLHPQTVRRSLHLAMLRYDAAAWGGLPRKRFLEALQAEGVPASPGYVHPLFANELFKHPDLTAPASPFMSGRARPVDYGACAAACPVAVRACRDEAVWLAQPLFLGTRADLQAIAEAMHKVYRYRDELLRTP